MRILLTTSIIFLLRIYSNAQNDSIIYNREFVFREGLYLSYSDFRNNQTIPKEQIVSKLDKNAIDFYSRLLNEYKDVVYVIEGVEERIDVNRLFGFCQNNTMYINYEKKFFRVPVFGNISYFVAQVEIYNYNNTVMPSSYYTYGMTATNMPVKTNEIRSFLFDFYENFVFPYDLASVEERLKKDITLYEEYMKLKKKERKQLMLTYIRKFNEKHPVKFPNR
jgi:hypothetical protein